MKYRILGNTGLKVSEIAFGAEWYIERSYSDVEEIIRYCEANGINFIDCWMSEPTVRTNLGKAIKNTRDKWIIQGHIGATWQNNQYVRTREMDKVKEAFEDFMERFQIDMLDFGMIHYVDTQEDYDEIMNGEFIEYVRDLKEKGIIKHIGFSTHSTEIAFLAAENPEIELLMFSINPAYDMFPPTDALDDYRDDDKYEGLAGLDPRRAELYQLCEDNGTPITVMKGYASGRLFDENDSPFGVALTPVQCIHYALEQKGVVSIFVGVGDTKELDAALEYETVSDSEKEYSDILANAPKHSFEGKCMYCGHCTPCTSAIDIGGLIKLYDLAIVHDAVPQSVQEHYNNLTYDATECIACGECEDRCPFNVKIVDIMLDAQDLFN
ncbi:aldo/keto reductase [uncultured Methanobrevibacter sp.]|uniref:aldo/keto reductase n=1 Tax=uncultured Methanobrevibacter sp. TaxID=253161 RepID=UPI0025CCFFAF|nr:aldo/keto reductase [uncultured Methanobrevibacter sp.]